jgi:putative glycosyltransferase (TIGR04372 family)
VFGLPHDAWFVLLHVREPGYHAAWHRHHPGTRNADIRTYEKVIDFVLAHGGWVVRGGDPTMKKIAPRERVIDYATSPRRSSETDILLCAECTYFVGTNSGFSVVPPVFGKRCALTNWSPIGIPNWYLDDIYIPKLVRPRGSSRYLSFAEMFAGIAGWSQFVRDYRARGLLIEDNSPEDLLDAVQELHGEVFGSTPTPSAEDTSRLERFNQIALASGGYLGSRIGYQFLKKYEYLLD